MKKPILTAILLIAAVMLTACGAAKDVSTPDAAPPPQDGADAAQAKPTAESAPIEADSGPEADNPVDLDLTQLSGTVVYSQVYDMMVNPDGYMGQKIRVKGSFSYFRDSETEQAYFAVLIADAAACCAQGIEFVWKGDHAYPRDYPPLDTEITVTGTFNTYFEDDSMFVQLTDADVDWQA